MKILVTGANGFVGSSVCADLVLKNHQVTRAIRNSGSDNCIIPNNLLKTIEVGNIDGRTDWTAALIGSEIVMHLAARVHVMKDKNINPLNKYREVNVDATINLATQAVKLGVKRFIFVSSVKVNGEATINQPFTSFDEPAPLDFYGQSKREAEIALMALSRMTGLEVVIIRPPLVYGPGVRANFLKLMRLVKMGVPLPFGVIHNRRSMVALDNLVDLLITCTHHSSASGQTFMVSDDNDVSIAELLRMLASAMGKRSILLPVPAGIIAGTAVLFGKSAMASRVVGSLQIDINHTKSTLGWKPVVTMQESINKTVMHFLAHH